MLSALMLSALIPASPGTTLALVAQTAGNVEQGTSASLRLVDVPALWVLVLIVVPLLAAIAWGGYLFGGGRVAMPPAARWLLGGLRFGALAILALILMRPVEVEQREDVFPAEVLVLLDDSASMQRKDAYGGDQDMRTALSELTSSQPEEAMRLELVQRALEDGLLADLDDKGYEVELYGFAERLANNKILINVLKQCAPQIQKWYRSCP